MPPGSTLADVFALLRTVPGASRRFASDCQPAGACVTDETEHTLTWKAVADEWLNATGEVALVARKQRLNNGLWGV
ncbi:MAG: hypothetical protein ACTHOD_12710, partial [Motilibacteraceae bacterium]